MATVDKASPRSEFDALKGRFEALCAVGGIGVEGRALFDALLMLFELLPAVFMERNTPKNARNSGLPSSRAGVDASFDISFQRVARFSRRATFLRPSYQPPMEYHHI